MDGRVRFDQNPGRNIHHLQGLLTAHDDSARRARKVTSAAAVDDAHHSHVRLPTWAGERLHVSLWLTRLHRRWAGSDGVTLTAPECVVPGRDAAAARPRSRRG